MRHQRRSSIASLQPARPERGHWALRPQPGSHAAGSPPRSATCRAEGSSRGHLPVLAGRQPLGQPHMPLKASIDACFRGRLRHRQQQQRRVGRPSAEGQPGNRDVRAIGGVARRPATRCARRQRTPPARRAGAACEPASANPSSSRRAQQPGQLPPRRSLTAAFAGPLATQDPPPVPRLTRDATRLDDRLASWGSEYGTTGEGRSATLDCCIRSTRGRTGQAGGFAFVRAVHRL
jgi:hypothetical protein